MLADHYFPCCSETGSTCYQHYVGLEHAPARLFCADPGRRLHPEASALLTLLVRHDVGRHMEPRAHDGG